MKILFSNDDGINAEGLRAMVGAFRGHELFVCAPRFENSGMSHALTVHKSMELFRYKDMEKDDVKAAWSLAGTPADCVKAYLEAIAKEEKFDNEEKFDAVISGINHGANLATDILYSGTVGAAREGFLHGINSFAVSLDKNSKISFSETATLAAAYIEEIVKDNTEPVFLNINFPATFAEGKPRFVFCRMGRRDYKNAFIKETDKDGREFFTIRGEAYDSDREEGTDIFAVKNGFVAVTPLLTDATDYKRLSDKN